MILIKCHAGCSAAEIAEAAGFNLSDLFPSRGAGDGGERGNGGPEAWASAAACATAVAQLADEFLENRNVDSFLRLDQAILIFKKVARAAMRESRGGATK